VRDNTLKLLLLAACMMLLTSILAHAAGLGRLTVLSTLGQPLLAEVELLSVQKGETITARLAAPEVYQQANAQYNNALVGTRVTVEKRSNGQLYLKATTPRPIHEPFIELLIEINSENGRVLRQYTALLDPPGYGSAAGEIPPPAVASAPQTSGPVSATPAPAASAPAAAPVPPPARGAAPARKPAASAAGARQYGPIKPGETLGRIARSVKPEGVSLEQALVGLYRENPDAFIKKNMNLVKSGKILRVPEAAELTAVQQREAVQEVRLQVADFNAFRGRIADRAGTASESGGVTSGRIGSKVADSAGPGPRDTVRLSRGEGKGKGKAGAADRVRELEEEVIAREKALAEANTRISQLEQIIKDSQRAAALKSSGAPAAQKSAEKAAAVSVPAPPGKLETPAATADKATPADAAKAGAPMVAEAPKGPDAAPLTAPPGMPEPVAKAEAKPMPEPPPPAPETDIMTTLLEEPLYLAALGGVVLLGGLGFMMARRRRSAAEGPAGGDRVKIAPSLGGGTASAPAAPAAAPKSALPPAAAARAPEPAPSSARAPAAAPRPARAAGEGDDNDLDFNVGMRRGPAATAGAGPQPGRQPAPRAPEPPTRAPEPPSAPAAPVLEPPAAAVPPRMPEPPPRRAEPPAATAAPTRAPEPPPRAPDHAARATEALRAAQARARAPEPQPLEPLMPDFALDSTGVTPAPAKPVPAAPAKDPNLMDFDLDPLPPVGAPLQMEKVSSEPPASVDFKLDLNDLDINAPAPSSAAPPARDDHWYDVQQKFDLAKAYEEMGDKSGARDILQEVLREGDTEQKSQAQKLLGSLG
jgi:pilus assembly protein FimV